MEQRDMIAVAAELFFSVNRLDGIRAVSFTRFDNHIKAMQPVEFTLPLIARTAAANSAPYHIGGSQP